MNNKIIILLITLVIIILGIKNLGNFFDITMEPKPGDIIVSLGGNSESRIKKTLELYENNISTSFHIILTGPTISEQNQSAIFLLKHGVQADNIIFSIETKNTMAEMKYIKKYLIDHEMTSAIVISDPPHSRRILFFANTVLDYPSSGLNIIVVGSDNTWWNSDTYYTNPTATTFVLNETVKLSYYYFQYLLGNLHE